MGLADELVPTSPAEVRAVGAVRLVEAVAAAACAPPTLDGNTPLVVAVRRASARLAAEAELHHREIAHALRITERSVHRAGLEEAPAALLRAARLQLALVATIDEARGGTPERASRPFHEGHADPATAGGAW